ncbi:hypothetical protein BFX06_03025 [Sulfobacillus thermosulfidooxidans]|uniref:UPF0122 protein SAMN00768000_3353 n=2 Tax=Sulfobacillus thermosulfidooxidans TaxID=28034 RepID=A0A1W1WM39_SULTA|nr:sigma factor-like helix-turn-helix DNA-binding protein [Sulfobacillus thermosulfidooxidans]OLZ09676.1 hypothetical protein BFX05_12015 [Sulfobacillus thermosulfidooxidans]OLZ16017.1 hypothetical protein BFX06_03025 [Sulfobacillus thermosulfidooxidans]OLZ18135.1 hypothetical protein BFX07_07100 [Sulfobacillus thermosulfidooxidans]PSR29879.1 MAG: RNA polymerase subunit sigma-70 [Sulfobacillus thermosulfidooxidans]SMC07374.1 hypothetical protein SAMN00768000_3353 [Sulfobacillus thermosulfidoox
MERLNRERANILYDIYGKMLTDHQRDVWRLYYLEDWSLMEIAEAKNVSRAAIHDLLDRSAKTLEQWEKQLSLIDHMTRRQQQLKSLWTLIHSAPKGPWQVEAEKIIEELAGEEGLLDV